MLTNMWLGVDFGTCQSSAALLIGETLKMVKDPNQSGFSLPSSVYVTESGKIRVGYAADKLRKQNPSCYRREFKRELGTEIPYVLGSHQLYPEDLAAEVIGQLKKEALEMIQGQKLSPIDSAIITVPATYQSHKRKLMEEAGKKAGFSNVKLLEEPVAAAVYYTKNYSELSEETILVYDLGGGTFDATLIQKRQSEYVILAAPVGLEHCGGVDFDRQIFTDIKNNCKPELFQLLNRLNQTPEAELARLIVSSFCRDFKHHLGQESEYEDLLIVPGLAPEKYSLSREAFNNAIAPLIAETLYCCHQLVKSAGIEWDVIDRILLVGGSCRIPYVKATVEKELKRHVLRVDDPELAVCQGAAIYGANLFPKLKVQSGANMKNKTDSMENLCLKPWEGW